MTNRLALATIPLALLLAACGNNPAPTPSESASAAPTSEAAPSSEASTGASSEAASSETTTAKTTTYPLTVENCGFTTVYEKAPERAITMNQGATEVMLSLGLEDAMVGTAYLDDKQINEKFKAAYDKVPVLAEKYPTLEQFLAAKPDFAFASYKSAFTEKATKERENLKADGINTYVDTFGCSEDKEPAKWDTVWEQSKTIAEIFGHPDKADAFIKEQKETIEKLKSENAGKGAKALWWDSNNDEPFIGGGIGGPQLIMDTVGLTNVFAEEKSNWFTGTWEKVLATDPDVIVLADASWDEAKAKMEHAKTDPVLKEMRAVKEDKFIVVPFSQTTPGVTLVQGAESVAKQLAEQK